MVLRLAQGHAYSRTNAYEMCEYDCRNVQLSSLKHNVKVTWALAGIGAYTAGHYAYDVWMNYTW